MNLSNFLILCGLLIPFAMPQSQNLIFFIEKIENNLKKLGGLIEEKISHRCDSDCSPSYDACSSLFPTFQCSNEFILSECRCSDLGRKVNFTTTTVKLADLISPYTDVADQDVKEIICATSNLDSEFQSSRELIPGIKWQYFGTYNGVIRVYPGCDWCEAYDHRTWPWYIAASSGQFFSPFFTVLID